MNGIRVVLATIVSLVAFLGIIFMTLALASELHGHFLVRNIEHAPYSDGVSSGSQVANAIEPLRPLQDPEERIPAKRGYCES